MPLLTMPLAKGPLSKKNLRLSLKWTPIDINAAFIKDAKLVSTCAGGSDTSLASHLEKISTFHSPEEQIQALKLMATSYSYHIKNASSPEAYFLINLFVNLVLQAQPNSPMQNALKKLLLSFDKTAHNYIIDSLSVNLMDAISSSRHRNLSVINCAINIIQECFSNFPLGIEAIDKCFHDVLHFLNNSLDRYISKLGGETSPAERTEVYLYIHTACGTLLPLLQKCCSMSTLVSNIDRDGNKEVLEDILGKCTLLAGNGEIPFDTRNNCGHIIVLLVVFMEGESGVLKLVTTVSLSLPGQVPRLIICKGLLNALTSQQLCLHVPDTTKTIITYLLDELLAFSERDDGDPTFVYGVGRSMVLLWRNLSDMMADTSHRPTLDSEPAAVIRQTLPFVWIYLDHYIDSVKFSAHNVLQSLVTASIALKDEATLEMIVDQVVMISPDKRSRYACIKLLAKLVGTLPLVDRIPNLIPSLITALEDMNIMTIAYNTLDVILDQSHKEVDSYQWVKDWISPIVLALNTSRNSTGSLEKLLASAFGRNPSCLSLVSANQDNQTPLKVILACVKIARRQYGSQLRDIEGSDESKRLWKGLVEYNTLEQALWHSDQEIRLSAFELIWDSRKVTEPFCAHELALLQTAIKYNMHNEDPTAKQATPTQVKRMLHRLNSSVQSLQRRVNLSTDSDDREILDAYSKFCSWLLEFCCSCLFRGANFGRRSTALEILTCCLSLIDAETLSQTLFTRDNATLLSNCLEDNFENNKALAHGILVKFPADVLRFDDPTHTKSWIVVALKLASSNRPPDCMTGGYIFLTLTSFSQSLIALSEMTGRRDGDPTFLAVTLLLEQLDTELRTARGNLLAAATSAPMYGSLFCIRTLLQNTDLSDDVWRVPILRLVETCYELTSVASPVVNNSSPEGYVPMDLELVSTFDCEGNETQVTAQLVLLCAWRTVKEASLFLGYVAERASIADDQTSGILNETHLLAMGTHLISLLSVIKHRGAFEQGCVGFTQLCNRLWAHPATRFNKIPSRWLAEILASVEAGEKLCATRRGAGLPFMVQALIVTEISSGSPPQCVGPTMVKLLEMATESSTLDVRTNALNVLRALVRHAQLGDLVMPHVADSMRAVLAGLKSSAWAERNSSTLLFSALMTRMFGVRRSKENRMTGYMFFLRYPQLHQVMLDELKVPEDLATVDTDSQYPTLLILARLTPSPPGTSQTAPQVTVYVPLVRACAASPIFETRVLAAKALVPLVTPDSYLRTLGELFDQVETAETANLRHGCLLQILHLLQKVPPSLDGDPALTSEITPWISQSLHMFASVNYLAMQVYVKVLGCFTKYMGFVAESCRELVRQRLVDSLRQRDGTGKGSQTDLGLGRRVYLESAAILLLDVVVVATQGSSDHYEVVTTTLLDLLRHEAYEVVAVGLDFLVQLLDNQSVDSDATRFECLGSGDRGSLGAGVGASLLLPPILTPLALGTRPHPQCRARALRALRCLPCVLVAWQGSVQHTLRCLLVACSAERDHMSCHLVGCVSAVLRQSRYTSLDGDTWVLLGAMLRSMAAPGKPRANRFAAASALVENKALFQADIPGLQGLAQCAMWTAAVNLLQDDDSDTRNLTASICSPDSDRPVTPQRALELLVQRFRCLAGSTLVRAACLLAWGLRDLCVGQQSNSQDCIFEKGDANTYAEDIILTELVCCQLGPGLKDSTMQTVDHDLMGWLLEETASVLTPLPATLGEFLLVVQGMMEAMATEQGYNAGSHKVASFLHPGHKTLQLDMHRLQKCLAAVL